MNTNRFDGLWTRKAAAVRLAVSVYAMLISEGCSKTLVSSRSPDGSSKIQINELCPGADCRVDVIASKGWLRGKTVAWRSDCFIYFAQVAWSPDSRLAGIYVGNAWCGDIREGYDLKTGSNVPFSTVAEMIRTAIVKDYGLKPTDLLPYHDDPLEWAHNPRDGSPRPAMELFHARFRGTR